MSEVTPLHCAFCGLSSDEAKLINYGKWQTVRAVEDRLSASVCYECLADLVSVVADLDPGWWDATVTAVRRREGWMKHRAEDESGPAG